MKSRCRFRSGSRFCQAQRNRNVNVWYAGGAAAGQRFGVGDLLVAALAVEHGCTLWSLDSDFGRMARLRMVTLADV